MATWVQHRTPLLLVPDVDVGHPCPSFSQQAKWVAAPPPPPTSARPALAPFGSVGGTAMPATTARATAVPAANMTPIRPSAPAPAIAGSSSPFSAGMERQLGMFVMSPPEDRYSGSGSSAIVREAQRRARRRAFSEQKRKAAAEERKSEDLEVRTQRPIVKAHVTLRTAHAVKSAHC